VFSGEGDLWVPLMKPSYPNENPNTAARRFYSMMKEVFPHLGAITASNGSLVRHVGSNYMMMPMPADYGWLRGWEDVIAAFREGSPHTTPEGARRQSLKLGALRHQLVVLLDHNPVSYKLRGIPNSHLDELFARK
jgi:hypothetical protein